jgi:hypothetical protein
MLNLGKELIKVVLSKNCVKFKLTSVWVTYHTQNSAPAPLNINLTQELGAGSSTGAGSWKVYNFLT